MKRCHLCLALFHELLLLLLEQTFLRLPHAVKPVSNQPKTAGEHDMAGKVCGQLRKTKPYILSKILRF